MTLHNYTLKKTYSSAIPGERQFWVDIRGGDVCRDEHGQYFYIYIDGRGEYKTYFLNNLEICELAADGVIK